MQIFILLCTVLILYLLEEKNPEVHKYCSKGIKIQSKVVWLIWPPLYTGQVFSFCIYQGLVFSQCSLEVNKVELSGTRKSKKFS